MGNLDTRKLAESEWRLLAKELVDWGTEPLGAEIWARSEFRCEYCGTYLLRDTQTYRFAQSDHILPQCKYPKLIGHLNNFAHACGLCNQLKRNWDPAENDSDLFQTFDSLSDEQRQMLIQRCNEYLEQKRRAKTDELEHARRLAKKYRIDE